MTLEGLYFTLSRSRWSQGDLTSDLTLLHNSSEFAISYTIDGLLFYFILKSRKRKNNCEG